MDLSELRRLLLLVGIGDGLLTTAFFPEQARTLFQSQRKACLKFTQVVVCVSDWVSPSSSHCLQEPEEGSLVLGFSLTICLEKEDDLDMRNIGRAASIHSLWDSNPFTRNSPAVNA